MTSRMVVTGMSFSSRAGAATAGADAAVTPLFSAARTSSLTMRPLGPEPCMASRGMFFSAAIFLASGEAKMRLLGSAGAAGGGGGAAGAGAGAGAGVG